MPEGILIIDKPAGWTSHDVVGKLRKIFRTKRIGHTGTLDPFATGVLVILIGRATRLAQFLDKDFKEYEAVIQFGFETDTGDKTGNPKPEIPNKKRIIAEDIEKVLPDFSGEIEQIPPMYSAKKVEGKKLYELARKGVEIERKPVRVSIYELEILSRELLQTEQNIDLRVKCSAGTYIRTLAEDIGKKLGTGAYLKELRRIAAGKFKIQNALTIENLEKLNIETALDKILISMNEAVSHLPEIPLTKSEIIKTQNGQKLRRENFAAGHNQPVRMTDENENLIAVGFYDKSSEAIQPKIVLV